MMLLGVVLIFSGAGVVGAPSAVYSALFLTVNLLAVGVLFLTLSSQFLAVAQLLIYAGAVMVVFMFAVTILSPDEEGPDSDNTLRLGGLAVGVVTLMVLAFTVRDGGPRGSGEASLTTVESFAQELFGRFLLPFEGTAFLLLVALIAAVVLGTRKREGLDRGGEDDR